jgi:hypothetical protein
MRQVNQTIVQKFNSGANRTHIRSSLEKQFPGNKLDLDASMSHFSTRIVNELYMSDPIGSIDYQVACFTTAFIKDRGDFLRALTPTAYAYSVGDGHPGSRYKQDLETWARNPAPGQTLRDDSQAACRNLYNDFSCDPDARITFCDQSHLGTSQHEDLFNTPWMQAMNRQVAPDDAGFGNPTLDGDKRLLERNVFRDHNKISQAYQRGQRRALDREIGETMPNTGERGNMQHGFDTTTLNTRMDIIRGPACQPGTSKYSLPPSLQKINLDTTNRWERR